MHRLYLVPTLLINVVIILVPALLTIVLAFFSWDGICDADIHRPRQFSGAVRRPRLLVGADQQHHLDA